MLLVGVAVAGSVTAALVWRDGIPISLTVARADATTTTVVPTPSTSIAELPAADAETTTIATSVITDLEVLDQLPAGVVLSPHQVLSDTASWAGYSPERSGAPEIPTIEAPVVGRYRTEVGWTFSGPDAYGVSPVFAVTERTGDWLHVLLPVRPNGTQGWVRMSDVSLSTTSYRIEVTVSTRSVRLLDHGTEVTSGPVIVGKAASPTPTGHFYVTDTIDKHTGSAYGPGILAISGFSQALDHFADGVPVLALHGTNRPDLLGTAASNGCVRMGDATINALRSTVPLGTPVDILP